MPRKDLHRRSWIWSKALSHACNGLWDFRLRWKDLPFEVGVQVSFKMGGGRGEFSRETFFHPYQSIMMTINQMSQNLNSLRGDYIEE